MQSSVGGLFFRKLKGLESRNGGQEDIASSRRVGPARGSGFGSIQLDEIAGIAICKRVGWRQS